MIVSNTLEQARETRHEGVLHNGTRYWRSDYLSSHDGPWEAPQAYLIEQAPGSVVPPHFHDENQFQVIVRGGGTLGRQEVRPVALHYVNGHTGYGPIVAEPDGLYYFTLRDRSDRGAKFLPQEKEQMRPGPRRNVMGRPVEVSDAEELRARREASLQPALDMAGDGLAAWTLRLGAGASAEGPDPAAGGGQYWLVLAGGLIHQGGELPRWGCLFASPDEAPLAARAGEAGLEVLILQFPRRPS